MPHVPRYDAAAAAKRRTLVYILCQHFMVNEFFKEEIREKSSLPSLKAAQHLSRGNKLSYALSQRARRVSYPIL
jgi:hypothetical protein